MSRKKRKGKTASKPREASIPFRKWIRNPPPEFRMLAVFALVFGIGQTLYRVFRDAIWPVWTVILNARVSAWVVNTLTPSEAVVLSGDTLISRGFSVQIKPGCDGMDAMILLVAAMVAFPMPWKRRLLGLGLGLFLLYWANIARTVVLYYSAKYRPELFDFLH
ncbi:MAG: hypothetical protein EOM25_13840, partial [Deltaproteobacteria bacterium]|nr:hypothetical protein [Deltaproteobacteria bacterium]